MSPQDTSRHTPNRVFRIDKEMWEAFTAAVDRHEPPVTRTEVIKNFMQWYSRERGAKLPERPPRPE